MLSCIFCISCGFSPFMKTRPGPDVLLSFSIHVALNCPKVLCVPEVTAEDYKPILSASF